MLKAIFNWFTGRPLPGTEAPTVGVQAAPYKIETPTPVATVSEPAPVAEAVKPVAASEPAPKAKRTATKKPAVKEPAAKPPAAPKKPRSPKK